MSTPDDQPTRTFVRRVVRIVTYEGLTDWVDRTLASSLREGITTTALGRIEIRTEQDTAVARYASPSASAYPDRLSHPARLGSLVRPAALEEPGAAPGRGVHGAD